MKCVFWGCILTFAYSFIAKDALAITLAFPDSNEKAGVIVHDNSIEVYHKLLAAIDSAQYYFEFCPCMAGGDFERGHRAFRCTHVSSLYFMFFHDYSANND